LSTSEQDRERRGATAGVRTLAGTCGWARMQRRARCRRARCHRRALRYRALCHRAHCRRLRARGSRALSRASTDFRHARTLASKRAKDLQPSGWPRAGTWTRCVVKLHPSHSEQFATRIRPFERSPLRVVVVVGADQQRGTLVIVATASGRAAVMQRRKGLRTRN
jgi:hypothetical protein